MKKIFNFKSAGRQTQKGVSLIELILYMAILTVLLTVLTSIFVSALDVQSESQATSSVEQDGNYILAKLNYDIHRAQNINIPATIGTTDNNFQIVIDGVNNTYNMDENNNLTLTDNLGTNSLNNYNTSISAFSVQRLGNVGRIEDSLKISFTVMSRAKKISVPETRDFETNISLRRQ